MFLVEAAAQKSELNSWQQIIQIVRQGLFCHLFHSDYCAAASDRDLLHLYMIPGTMSLQQTQPYFLNHLSLGQNGRALSVGRLDQTK